MKTKAFPFLVMAAIALVIVTFRLLNCPSEGIREVGNVSHAEAQPQPQPLPEALVKGAGRLTVDDLRAFDRFPVFWVGPEYQGHPVTKILYMRSSGSPDGTVPPSESIRIQYGTCDPGQGPPEEGGCVRPLTIYSEPLCYNAPGRLAQGAHRGLPLEIRGAQVQPVQAAQAMPDTGDTHFYFGESTVVISAAEGYGATIQAFENLRGVNPAGVAVAAVAGAELRPAIPEDECGDFHLPPIQPPATPTPTGDDSTAIPVSAATATAQSTVEGGIQ